MSEPPPSIDAPPLTRGQWLLLFVLAAVQFTHTVDFVIIMPLAPHLTADEVQGGLGIGTRQFGMVVSAYGLTSFLAGLLLARWLDRFDRKRTLLLLYAGFTLGTLLCAVAPDYPWLLAGRALAGGFGGSVAANVFAIIGDAFVDRRRGQATGVVMSAFSIASIAGVPAGLYLAEQSLLGWRAPFLALAVGSFLLLLLAMVAIPSLRSHLRPDDVTKVGLRTVLSRRAYLQAYSVMFAVVFAGFLVIPFIADFLVKNVGVTTRGLQLMYILGGFATLGTMNVVGKLADRFPRLMLFRILGALALIPVVTLTCLPNGTPLALVLVVSTCMMILMSGRMVPLTAITTGIAQPRERGAFMSVMAAVQQLGAATAPVVASLLMSDTKSGEPLVGLPYAGLASVVVGVLALFLAGMLVPKRAATEQLVDAAPSGGGHAVGGLSVSGQNGATQGVNRASESHLSPAPTARGRET